jgi:hypothetical protein
MTRPKEDSMFTFVLITERGTGSSGIKPLIISLSWDFDFGSADREDDQLGRVSHMESSVRRRDSLVGSYL